MNETGARFRPDRIPADVRHALRGFRKAPLFSAVAILTLALGIGANTAIFSVLDLVLRAPLPYSDPERIVMVWARLGTAGQTRVPASGPQLIDLRRRSRLLQSVAGVWVGTGALTGREDPEQVRIGFVTENFFSTLGVRTELGRIFAAGDEGPSASPVVVLSDALWRRRFGGDPGAVGRSILVDGRSCVVAGVLPAGLGVPFPADANVPADVPVWMPFRDDLSRSPRDLSYIRTIARLRPGTTQRSAQEELSEIGRRLRAEFREEAEQGTAFEIAPMRGEVVRDIRPTLLALFGGVGIILLIACVNVANLLLVRSARTRSEILVRFALGASRTRIVQQVMTESVLLSLLGGVAGLALGSAALRLLVGIRPEALARIDGAHLSLPVLAATFLVAAACGLLFGLAPVAASTDVDLSAGLRSARAGSSRSNRPQRLLILIEVALGFVLLVGCGLIVRTLARVLEADPGFRSKGVLTFQVSLPEVRYPKDEDRRRVVGDILRRVREAPGVFSAGVVSHIPFDDYPNWYESYWRPGTPPAEQNVLMADHRAISPGFFESVGARLIAGRDFRESDAGGGHPVIVVDDWLAERTWGHASPVGKTLNVVNIRDGSFDRTLAEVIGVVRHVRYEDVVVETRGQVYVPYVQSPRDHVAFTVRGSGDPGALAPSVRSALRRVDPDLPFARPERLERYEERAAASTRFTTAVAALLALLAVALACTGIYGVAAYSVSMRTPELGVRIALGARPARILAAVIGDVAVWIAGGLLAGLALAFPVTRLLTSLLYGVGPRDPATIAAAAAVLVLSGLLAALIPARRAMKIDPIAALRAD